MVKKINLEKIEKTNDELFKNLLKKSYDAAEKSNHPTSHIGALLVDKEYNILLEGTNSLPDKVKPKPLYFEGENRHIFPNHAERDLIYKAAKIGLKTDGTYMVMGWIPCINCANAIITSGIEKIIVHEDMIKNTREAWIDELNLAIDYLTEAGVKIIAYSGKVGAEILMSTKRLNV